MPDHVHPRVFWPGDEFEVGGVVVEAVAVPVVHELSALQGAPQDALHDEAMLENFEPRRDENFAIALTIEASHARI